MLTCQQLAELITDYLEGQMSLMDRVRFRTHLRLCPACRAYLTQMQQTIRILGSLPPESIPSELRQELLAHFRDWQS
jgi:predicted anti-sigma-YlaC factor YlaD